MKRIILTCTGNVPPGMKPPRFAIDINDVGDAQIVREGAPLVERDRCAGLSVQVHGEYGYISLAVETEP